MIRWHVLGGAQPFRQRLASYFEHLSGEFPTRFLISAAQGGPLDCDEIKQLVAELPDAVLKFDQPSNYIDAMNAHMPGEDFDVLIAVSDQHAPVQAGFDWMIAEDFARLFESFDGALSYGDGTAPIMGLPIYARMRHIFCPDYASVAGAIAEFSSLCRKLGRFQRIATPAIQSEAGVTSMPDPMDEKLLRRRRRSRNFGIKASETPV